MTNFDTTSKTAQLDIPRFIRCIYNFSNS